MVVFAFTIGYKREGMEYQVQESSISKKCKKATEGLILASNCITGDSQIVRYGLGDTLQDSSFLFCGTAWRSFVNALVSI